MFNLEEKILEWRQQMLVSGIKSPVPMEELESHLRDEIEQRMKSGLHTQVAFEVATGQIGPADTLKNEFVKASTPIHEQLKHFIFNLAGLSNHQLAIHMNVNHSDIEPRWTTYAKAGTFLFPAVFLWLFTVAFVMPKAAEICQAAGTTVFSFSSAPFIVGALASVGQLMVFLSNHCVLIGGATGLTFFLMERYLRHWPRYRRATIGLGAFLLNAVVLLSMTMMIVSILIAAPSLAHHVK